MTDADDEEDYMADLSRFIPNEATSRNPQGRNGRLASSNGKEKQKLPLREKRKAQQEQQKKDEDEQRKEGLGSAIPSSNIGFKMLQQMGYRPGVALGKHGQGLAEPVNIDLKRSRTGLGRDDAAKQEELLKAKRAELEALRNTQKEKELRADFQERSRGSWHSRKIISDYRKACATYLQLKESLSSSLPTGSEQQGNNDESASDPVAKPKDDDDTSKEPQKDDDEEEEEEITPEMLLEILEKLRSQHHYCLYCGYKYDSSDALLANCPGLDDDSH